MDRDLAAALVDAAPVGILVVDATGTITFASPSVDDLTGYGFADVVGTSILSYLPEAGIAGLVESVDYVTTYTDAVMGPTSLGFVHADGELRVLEVYATNRFDDPHIAGLVVAVRDQTFQYRINEALASYTDGGELEDALHIVCAAMVGLPLRARAAIVDADGRRLSGIDLPAPLLGRAPAGAPPRPWEAALAGGEAVCPGDLRAYDADLQRAAADAGFATVWAVPLAAPAATGGQPLGCFVLGRVEALEPSVNERYTLATAVRSASLLVERHDLVTRLGAAARTDALTGLANRDHLLRPREVGAPTSGDDDGARALAVLYIDLDGFKPVNDGLGHAAGDAVLQEVARRLAAVTRRGDELGRVGGDEFVMLCWDLDDPDELAGVAERLVTRLATPIAIPDDGEPSGGADTHAGRTVTIGASVGAALTRLGGTGRSFTDDLDDALRRADEALYDAKRAGRGRWRLAP
ncbi:MAG: sensor domain-containing diguanylate cyclase [Acidimicrobiales bacterium]